MVDAPATGRPLGMRPSQRIRARVNPESSVVWSLGPCWEPLWGFRRQAVAKAAADTRTLDLYNTHTKERLTITFKKNGKFVGSALKELNRFLRDWRRNEPTNMDPRLFDTVWEVYTRSKSRQPIHVVSGYRSLATNDMLRSRSRAVAKHSQHTLGKAMDFFLPDVKTATLREIGISMQRGGVGFYPNAHNPFVHIDVGSVRAWPRMTRQQLVRIFPDGKTVHLPADGKPLAGYQEALAELKRNGVTRPLAIADEETSSKKGKGLLAMLFGDEEDEAEELNSAAPGTTGQSLTAGDDEAPAAAEPAPAAPEPPPVVVAAAPAKAPEAPAAPPVTSLADATLPAGAAPPPVVPQAPAELVAAAPTPPPPRQRPEGLEEAFVVAAIDPTVLPRPRPVIAIAEEAPVQLASVAPVALPAPALPAPAAVVAAATGEPANARQALEAVAEDPLAPIPRADSMLGYASAVENAPASLPEPKMQIASLTSGPAMPGQRPAAADRRQCLLPSPTSLIRSPRSRGRKSRPACRSTMARNRPIVGPSRRCSIPTRRAATMVFTSPSFIVVASFRPTSLRQHVERRLLGRRAD